MIIGGEGGPGAGGRVYPGRLLGFPPRKKPPLTNTGNNKYIGDRIARATGSAGCFPDVRHHTTTPTSSIRLTVNVTQVYMYKYVLGWVRKFKARKTREELELEWRESRRESRTEAAGNEIETEEIRKPSNGNIS